ncbi:MAG: beta-ketoacyl-[acyl-carrier-protein] synthase family protein, partial [Halobacteriovoraceae bacterium]|nr:beta-ketoacyl-[acyl-carrier-protein] synthase family protein [Halobacteriovoraceae bacterium]
AGDIEECKAINEVFANSKNTYFNCTKGLIGHTMGAAGALELAGNLPGFTDHMIHSIGHDLPIDPQCHLPRPVIKKTRHKTNIILNNSFGMLGINTVLIIKKFSNGG